MASMGQLVGGSFLSAFLQVSLDRFASPELLDFLLRWEINLDEVESLKRTTALIQALSDEAEVKQFTNRAVKLWLDYLKQLLYDAEDILDEYATELLRLKLEYARQTQEVRNSVLHTPSTESSISSWLNFGLESAIKGVNGTFEGIKDIGSKVYGITEELLEIKKFGAKVRDMDQRLKSVAQEGVALGLNSSIGFGSSRPMVFSQRPPTSSLVNKYKVFGREEDMEKIVRWLLSDKTQCPSDNNNNFSVLPIVGMGGVGKTTLAQLVYNDVKVKKHFQLKGWVCVSEDFDVVRLTREILESVTGSSPPPSSLDLLQVKLQEALSEKRFLLVLDDMWNENYERWDALSTIFSLGELGSKILVTTRHKGVASMLCTVPNNHCLEGLSEEACLSLVRMHAFYDKNSPDANLKLELFGKEIVRKCKGLPLAVKTLAGLLRDKRESSQWKAILENEIWELKESEILPSLMLSYHHLPPILKRCFAYCALFPKDYVFSKMETVAFWMAEGIVQSKDGKRPEDIGGAYFDELFMRSFFEVYNRRHALERCQLFTDFDLSKELRTRSYFESSDCTGLGFVVHDLIHDLAQFVSAGIYCRRENGRPSQVLTTTRHLSCITDNYDAEVTEFEAMKSLRSFLTLVDTVGSPRNFFPPMQFKFQFQFLRVLRFRNCCNCELPDSIGKLKHLRLLDLSFSDIIRLPDSVGNLYNLHLLKLTGCGKLRELPADMSNLVSLRYLFLPAHLGFHKIPSGVGYLTGLQSLNTFDAAPKKVLSQLCGTTKNSNWGNVSSIGAEAMVAKPHLHGLQLHNLISLRVLRISKCENLESLSKELYTLTSLQRLLIGSCPDLVSFHETRLPTALLELKIFDCENLRTLPKELPTLMYLKELVIDSCPALVSFLETGLPPALEELHIIDCENLECLPMGLLHSLTVFQRLQIKECPALESIPDVGLSTALQEVSILNCGLLNSLPRGLQNLTNLKQLEIVESSFLMQCKNLEPLYTSGLQSLISLSYLTIGGCHALVSIPKGLLPKNLRDFCIKDCPILEFLCDALSDLTSIKSLEIQKCPMLTQQFQKKEREEWLGISQIPEVIIDGTWQ